jgi:hypothetical protein
MRDDPLIARPTARLDAPGIMMPITPRPGKACLSNPNYGLRTALTYVTTDDPISRLPKERESNSIYWPGGRKLARTHSRERVVAAVKCAEDYASSSYVATRDKEHPLNRSSV